MNKKKILYISIGMLLFITSLNATTRECYDFIIAWEYFVLFPLLAISLITSITLSIIDYIHKTRYRVIHIVIFASIGIGLLGGHQISIIQNKTSIKNLKTIVSAINEYKKENKSYPHNLQELTPIYLDKIPTSYCGITQLNYYYYPDYKNDTVINFLVSVYDRPSQTLYRFSSERNHFENDESMYH
jgi:hypothetical protein